MQVSAKLKNLRISPRKVRLMANVVRGKDIQRAKIQLQFSTKKSSGNILTLLNSAVANAKNNFNLDEDSLFISNIIVNEGPTLKRWRPRAMGRASAIHKRTCTIEIFLDEKESGKKEEAKASPEKKGIKKEEKPADMDETMDQAEPKKEEAKAGK